MTALSEALHTKISIHALREEGDLAASGGRRDRCNFYPRPPRGGRPFLGLQALAVLDISIHALREEGDGRSAAACGH